jgi:hypothetical protein
VDGIRDVAECGRGSLVVYVHESFLVPDRVRLGVGVWGGLYGFCVEGWWGE